MVDFVSRDHRPALAGCTRSTIPPVAGLFVPTAVRPPDRLPPRRTPTEAMAAAFEGDDPSPEEWLFRSWQAHVDAGRIGGAAAFGAPDTGAAGRAAGNAA